MLINCDWVWRLQYGARYYALVGIGWSSAGGYPGSDVYCGMFFVHMSEHPTSSVMSIGACYCDWFWGNLSSIQYALCGGRADDGVYSGWSCLAVNNGPASTY